MTKKVRKAEAVPQKVEGNGLLALAEYVLLPVAALKTGKKELIVERRDGEERAVLDELEGSLKVVEEAMDIGEEDRHIAAGGKVLGDLDGGDKVSGMGLSSRRGTCSVKNPKS